MTTCPHCQTWIVAGEFCPACGRRATGRPPLGDPAAWAALRDVAAWVVGVIGVELLLAGGVECCGLMYRGRPHDGWLVLVCGATTLLLGGGLLWLACWLTAAPRWRRERSTARFGRGR